MEEAKPKVTYVKSTVGWLFAFLLATISSFQIGHVQAQRAQPTKVFSIATTSVDCTDKIEVKPEPPKVIEEPVEEVVKPLPEESVVSPTLEEEQTAERLSELKAVKKYYLLLRHSDGRYELRTGGSPSWRYNNPGKLAFGNFSESNGAIGNDGPLAIFSTYDSGKKAFETFLFKSDFKLSEKTISQVIEKLAASKYGYNTKDFLASVLKKTGQKSTKYLKDMTVDEREDFIEAFQETDFWVAGNITTYKDKSEFIKKGY